MIDLEPAPLQRNQRHPRRSIVERAAEALFAFLQGPSLFLQSGGVASCLFSLRQRNLDVFQIHPVGVIKDGDDRGRDDDGVEADSVGEYRNDAGGQRARKVCDGCPQVRPRPCLPIILAALESPVDRGKT